MLVAGGIWAVSTRPTPDREYTVHLYRVRCVFANTAELEPRYVIARNEEEAAETFFLLYSVHSEDIEMPCELTVERIASGHENGGSDAA